MATNAVSMVTHLYILTLESAMCLMEFNNLKATFSFCEYV